MRWLLLILALGACADVRPWSYDEVCRAREGNYQACIDQHVRAAQRQNADRFIAAAPFTNAVLAGVNDGLAITNWRNDVRAEVRYWQRNPIR
jgi:hypothetical protein